MSMKPWALVILSCLMAHVVLSQTDGGATGEMGQTPAQDRKSPLSKLMKKLRKMPPRPMPPHLQRPPIIPQNPVVIPLPYMDQPASNINIYNAPPAPVYMSPPSYYPPPYPPPVHPSPPYSGYY